MFSETHNDIDGVWSPETIDDLDARYPPWEPGYKPYRATSNNWNPDCDDFDFDATCGGIEYFGYSTRMSCQ